MGLGGQTPACSLKNTDTLELSLNYKFQNKSLLEYALTHKSYHHENPQSTDYHNERLEFLGDSLLGLVVAEALFKHPENMSEAMMSKTKSFLVNEDSLYKIAHKINLGSYLRLGKGEEVSGGRDKKSILADATEALFGAIFLDSDYLTAKNVILSLFGQTIDDVISQKESHDPKSALQELSQSLFGSLPQYVIVKQEGQEHQKVFTVSVMLNGEVYGTAKGKSKKQAQALAAKEALERLKRSEVIPSKDAK